MSRMTGVSSSMGAETFKLAGLYAVGLGFYTAL